MLAASLYIVVVSLVTVLKTMPADDGSSDSNSEYSGPDSVERITRANTSFDPYMSKCISFNSENVSGPKATTTIMSSMELSEYKRRQLVEDSDQITHWWNIKKPTRLPELYYQKVIDSLYVIEQILIHRRNEHFRDVVDLYNVYDELWRMSFGQYSNTDRYPFITIEGLDGSMYYRAYFGRLTTIIIDARTVARTFASQTGSAYLENPPIELWDIRHRFYNQTALLKRTFYAVANYYVARQALKLVKNQPIILSRYYYTCIGHFFALRHKEKLKAPPCRGSKSYQWPLDLFKPDVAFYIHVDNQKKKRQLQFQTLLVAQNFPESYLTVMKNTQNPKVVILDGNMAPEILLNKIHRHVKLVGLNITVTLWRSK